MADDHFIKTGIDDSFVDATDDAWTTGHVNVEATSVALEVTSYDVGVSVGTSVQCGICELCIIPYSASVRDRKCGG